VEDVHRVGFWKNLLYPIDITMGYRLNPKYDFSAEVVVVVGVVSIMIVPVEVVGVRMPSQSIPQTRYQRSMVSGCGRRGGWQ
jgi:hypothetical protein